MASVSARNVNPRHKLTITMNNFVLQTVVGQAVHAELMYRFPRFNYVYGCTVGNIRKYPCAYKKAFKVNRSTIVIHPDMHTASNEYLSWIMVQAMTKMIYEKKYQLTKYSRLRVVEIEQMVFLTAQLFWEELNPPISRDLDLFNSPMNSIARRLDLSVFAFTRIYDVNFVLPFLNKVATRAKRKDGITRSASDIITGVNYSKEEKRIARNIIDDIYGDLLRLEGF